MNRIIISLIILAAVFKLPYAQVTVAPVSVHLSDAEKNGYIIIRNTSSNAVWEVGIDIKFGYPASDSSGNTVIHFPDTVSASDPSAVEWIKFYPRKFILQPLGEQTVRIAAKPPSGVRDGEYWGRPVITSRQSGIIDTVTKKQINAGLNVEFRTVIALNYRKGKVTTGVSITKLSCTYDNGKFIIFTGLKRDGNSAYIGKIEVVIKNDKGDKIKEISQEISVYYELNKRIEIGSTNLQKGSYLVEVNINTDREETGGKILKGNTVSKSLTLTID